MTYEATSIVNAILIAFLAPAALCFALWFVIWVEQMVPGELRAKMSRRVRRVRQTARPIGGPSWNRVRLVAGPRARKIPVN